MEAPGDVHVPLGRAVQLLLGRDNLLVSPRDTREPLLGVGAFLVPLRLGIFSVSNSDNRFQLQVAPLDAVVDFKDCGEDEGRARDGAPHPILAPFHAAGQIDLTLPGQQRYGAHFPEVDPHGIARVERLFAGAPWLWSPSLESRSWFRPASKSEPSSRSTLLWSLDSDMNQEFHFGPGTATVYSTCKTGTRSSATASGTKAYEQSHLAAWEQKPIDISRSHEESATSPSNLFKQRVLGRIGVAVDCYVGNPGPVSLSSFNGLEDSEVRLDQPLSASVDSDCLEQAPHWLHRGFNS